jgi:hypothetical protein
MTIAVHFNTDNELMKADLMIESSSGERNKAKNLLIREP